MADSRRYRAVPALLAAVLCASCATDTEVCTGDEGEQIYKAWCASCHGDDLQGWAADPEAKGPGLAGEGLRQWWAKLTRDGVAGRYGADSKMIAIGTDMLEDDELDDVLKFILDKDKAGQKLYFSACGQCHGVDPAKGGSGPALAGKGLTEQWMEATRLRHTPADALPMPEFPLCEDDLKAVVGYLLK